MYDDKQWNKARTMPGKFFNNPEYGPSSPGGRDKGEDKVQEEKQPQRRTISMFARSALVTGTQLSKQKEDALKRAFSVYDKNGDGHISYKELGIVMKSMGMKLSGPELEVMYEQVDTDKDGKISFDEFKVMMERKDKTESASDHTEVCCFYAPYYLLKCMKIEGAFCCNKSYEVPGNGPTVCKFVDMINYCCLVNVYYSSMDDKSSMYQR